MKRSRLLALLPTFALAGVAGCAKGLPPVNAISYDHIQKVVAEVKRQLSVYQATANAMRENPRSDPARQAADPRGYICGKGLIDFSIASVTLDLTTTTDSTGSGNLGFSVPIIGPVGAAGASGAISKEENDTQELSIPLYPVPDTTFLSGGAEQKAAPISDALMALRKALIVGATNEGVCFYDYKFTDPKTDPGGTYKVGLVVTDDSKGGINVQLSVLTLSAGYEQKSLTGNSILVTFHQSPLPKKPLMLDDRGVPKPGQDVGEGLATPMPHPPN